MQNIHYLKGEDVKTHLTRLRTYCKNLIAMSINSDDDNFIMILFESLPNSYNFYLLAALIAILAFLMIILTFDVYIQGISSETND